MSLTEAQKALLAEPLNSAHIKKPTGNFGPKGDYIEGWHAIAEANRIFGFDGWSYTIDLTQNDIREAKAGNGNQQWQAAYTCVATVTAGGVTRQDVGFGSGFAKNIGDAIEGATKEAATDALKRALRTFGNPFGLALYDKQRANVQDGPPSLSQDDMAMIDEIQSKSSVTDLDQWLKANMDRAGKSPNIAAIQNTFNAQREKAAA